jgi:hypothetical protein
VWRCRCLPPFVRNVLPRACSSETLVTTCKATWRHNPEDHNQEKRFQLSWSDIDHTEQNVRFQCGTVTFWLPRNINSTPGGSLLLWPLIVGHY